MFTPATRRRRTTSALLLLALSGCLRAYRPPRAEEPHAVLKFRRNYAETAGVDLHEVLMIDKRRAFSNNTTSRLAQTPQTTALLIHPTAITLTSESEFSHQEMRWIYETYYETETYFEYDSVRKQTVSRTRHVPRTRPVYRRVRVLDASCRAGVSLLPQDGSTYLVQFTFQDDRVCQLACYEQTSLGDGTLELQPCLSATE